MRIVAMLEVLPDELLYSFLGRLAQFNAAPNSHEFIDALLGAPGTLPSIELPTRLHSMHANFGSFSPLPSVDRWIEVTTLYPYFRNFLPLLRRAKVHDILLHGDARGLKAMIGLLANGFGASTVLRYCPRCVDVDMAKHQCAYWHRTHHLPGVTSCAAHDLTLLRHHAPARSQDKQAFHLLGNSHQKIFPKNSMRSPGIQEHFAKLSSDSLTHPLDPIKSGLVREVYAARLQALGLMDSKFRVRYQLLTAEVRRHFNDFEDFQHQARLLSSQATPLAWLRTLLSRPDVAVHPMCHLLMIEFLYGGWFEFRTLVQQHSTRAESAPQDMKFESKQSKSALSKTKLSTHSNKRMLFHPSLGNTQLSCREAARLSNLSPHTVAQHRRRLGITIRQTKCSIAQALQLEIAKDMLSGIPAQIISANRKVSLSTVYRLRALHIKDLNDLHAQDLASHILHQREMWRSLLQQQTCSIKQARQQSPACYAWLYRNDRDWLCRTNEAYRSQKPPTRRPCRVDWPKRDALLCSYVSIEACVWKKRNAKNLLTKARLRRCVGERMLQLNSNKLPKTVARIAALAER